MSEPSQFGIVSYKKGSIIAVEGRQKAECFFIIQRGNIRVSKEAAIPGYEDETLGEGDIFGVVAAVSYKSHIQTAVATTDAILITVGPGSYGELIRNNGQVAMNILVQLSSKLRAISEALTANEGKGAGNSMSREERFSRMFEIGEYYFVRRKHLRANCVYTKYLRHWPDGPSSPAVKNRLEKMAGNTEWVGTDYGAGDVHRTYRKDEMISVEGEPGEEFFILQSGSVEVVKIVEGKEVLLAVLKPGDIFGEMALLNDEPRNACTVAAEPCLVMAVNRASFMHLTMEQPHMVYKITSIIANRLWFSARRLENNNIKEPLGRVYGILLIHLERDNIPLDSRNEYLFPVGWDEITLMLGFSEKEGFIRMGELQQKDKNVHVKDGKIKVESVQELVKAAEHYRRFSVGNEKTGAALE